MVLYSAARIEYNLCGSVIQKHTHIYPLTQMITWEASSLLGQGFYFTVHYSIFSATFCCARTGTGTGTGNRVMAILEPWNRVTIFPVLVTCLLTVNVQRLSEKLCFAYCFFQALNLYF